MLSPVCVQVVSEVQFQCTVCNVVCTCTLLERQLYSLLNLPEVFRILCFFFNLLFTMVGTIEDCGIVSYDLWRQCFRCFFPTEVSGVQLMKLNAYPPLFCIISGQHIWSITIIPSCDRLQHPVENNHCLQYAELCSSPTVVSCSEFRFCKGLKFGSSDHLWCLVSRRVTVVTI